MAERQGSIISSLGNRREGSSRLFRDGTRSTNSATKSPRIVWCVRLGWILRGARGLWSQFIRGHGNFIADRSFLLGLGGNNLKEIRDAPSDAVYRLTLCFGLAVMKSPAIAHRWRGLRQGKGRMQFLEVTG